MRGQLMVFGHCIKDNDGFRVATRGGGWAWEGALRLSLVGIIASQVLAAPTATSARLPHRPAPLLVATRRTTPSLKYIDRKGRALLYTTRLARVAATGDRKGRTLPYTTRLLRRISWLPLLYSLFVCCMVMVNVVPGARAGEVTPHAAWASSMYKLLPPLGSNYSCRLIARSSLGGRAVRIRLSNLMGTTSLTFGAVFAGLRTTGATLNTNKPVTFRGSTRVIIPPGQELSSDPIPLAVSAGQDLAVSVYVPDSNEPVTDHVKSFVTSYCTNTQGGGNQAATLSGTSYTRPIYDMYWLTAVDVYGQAGGTIVTLGDSITNGSASTYDGYNRWTDVLSRRLLNEPEWRIKSVANASISGNEICASNPYDGSPSALARLKRDVLDQSGVTHVILFEGTNDLAYGGPSHNGLSGGDVITCMEEVIEQVHATGLSIMGATIIPRSFDNARESARQQVNAWIRTSDEFDEVIDFDAIVRDPNNPAAIAPMYDSGDHIHPNAAGHAAMGNAIDVSSR